MRNAFRSLFSLFLSETCYACDQPLSSQETLVCLSCLDQIEETGFHHQMDDNELFHRLAGRMPLQGASSLFYFDKAGKLQHLIQALKYEHTPQLGTFLGAYLGETIQGSPLLNGVEALIPVPLHPKKKRQRGYNQAELIARGAGEVLGIPVRADMLERIRYTKAQARQAGVARRANVQGAFLAKGDIPAQVMLVDDVITTGATLEACSQALLAADQPPTGIRVASVAMARA